MGSSPPEPLVFAIHGPIAPADLPGLCDRVCALLRARGAGDVACDAAGVPADAVTVDALARLQLAAGRCRCRVRIRNASPELLDLLAFLGLTDVIPEGDPAPPEQTEEGLAK